MPVYSRQTLRRHLSQFKLRDAYIGVTSGSSGVSGSGYIIDAAIADSSLLNDNLYARTWIRVNGMELRVASLNTFSGAYVTAMAMATMVPSGTDYEHHRKLQPLEKDFQIDRVIERLWSRQELPINTVDGLLAYSIGNGFKVFGAYYFASPLGTLDRFQRELPVGWSLVTTGSGTREIRLPVGGALAGSQQLVLDAQVRASLGASDTATVNIPDEDWVLNGITARCYQSMAADSPSSESKEYQQLAQAFGRSFRDGVGAFRDQIDSNWRGAFNEFVGDWHTPFGGAGG